MTHPVFSPYSGGLDNAFIQKKPAKALHDSLGVSHLSDGFSGIGLVL
jgi:hypothetical protein